MNQRTFNISPILFVCALLLSSYSITAEAILHQPGTSVKDIQGSGLRFSDTDMVKILGKDCVSCAPEQAPGNPLSGNKSVRSIAMVANQQMSQEESIFYSYLSVYCLTLLNLRSEKDFNKKLMASMAETAPRGDLDPYWQKSNCEPRYLEPPTKSPLLHIMAENTRDRTVYIQYLKKYYEKKNDLATFKKVINAKNTRGQTVLDYIQQSFSEKHFLRTEEAALNKFIQFLCDNGAEYATTKNKKCPAEYLYLYK